MIKISFYLVFCSFQAAYNIGGHTISADTIQSSILGCRMSRPGQVGFHSWTSNYQFFRGDYSLWIKHNGIWILCVLHFVLFILYFWLIKLASCYSGFGCFFLQEQNSRLEMSGKHTRLTTQSPFYTLHSVQEATLILRYLTILVLYPRSHSYHQLCLCVRCYTCCIWYKLAHYSFRLANQTRNINKESRYSFGIKNSTNCFLC